LLRLLLFNLVIDIHNFQRPWTFMWIALHLLAYWVIKYFIILLALNFTLVFLYLTFIFFYWTFISWIHKNLTIFLYTLIHFKINVFNVLWIAASWYGYISVAMNHNVSELVVRLLDASLGGYFFERLFFLSTL
jgi:hypothetical protein